MKLIVNHFSQGFSRFRRLSNFSPPLGATIVSRNRFPNKVFEGSAIRVFYLLFLALQLWQTYSFDTYPPTPPFNFLVFPRHSALGVNLSFLLSFFASLHPSPCSCVKNGLNLGSLCEKAATLPNFTSHTSADRQFLAS